jgi:hypothetical protein
LAETTAPVLPNTLDTPDAEAILLEAVTSPLPLIVNWQVCVESPQLTGDEFTVANARAVVPELLVASPENAGMTAAGRVPLVTLLAFVVSIVADAANPEISDAANWETVIAPPDVDCRNT